MLQCLARTQGPGNLAEGQWWSDKLDTSNSAEYQVLGLAVWTGGFHRVTATSGASP